MKLFFKNTYLFLGSWLLLSFSSEAQVRSSAYELISSIPVEAKFFTSDKLQQLYIVTPDNTVIKYSPDGEELFRYNNNTIGELTHIDATNPFNLLLYYPEFQTAITLDRTLNKIGEFNLWDLQVVDVRAVGLAVDNGLWVFDAATYTLKKISQEGQLLRQSDNLSLLLGLTPSPSKLVARANFVYVNDPGTGILVFDNFGQYDRSLPITGIDDFQVVENRILYQIDNAYFIYNLKSFGEMQFPLPQGIAEPLQVRLQKDQLYVLLEKRLNVYGGNKK